MAFVLDYDGDVNGGNNNKWVKMTCSTSVF